jgi:uroporphyrinogen-III decarboxylase
MGVNAAQLLLSRLHSEVELRPRHVVLPTRLVVRHSCGSQLGKDGRCPLSVPISDHALGSSTLVKPLSPEERQSLTGETAAGTTSFSLDADLASDYDKSDAGRLLAVLRHQEADRVPHIEFQISSRLVYEYVLEHELDHDTGNAQIATQSVTPEEQVEFALRLGMDAVPCNFYWHPRSAEPADLEPPPSLADQLSNLERYLRAAQGTNVGVVGCFSSFFDTAMSATGLTSAPHRLQRTLDHLEQLMDVVLDHQARVMRVVTDRFGADLALIMVKDNIAHHAGLVVPTELFMRLYQPRMTRLLAPAKEHGKLLLMHTSGKVDQVLPILREVGFDGVHPLDPRFNDIFELRERWKDKMALIGNIPVALLARGDKHRIEERVREYCSRLAPGGGFVLSSSGPITREIPPANLVAMTRAVHKYGRFGHLGRAA